MADSLKPSDKPSQILRDRLEGIRQHLLAVHRSGTQLADASKGFERELFLSRFLSRVMPSPFRFGTGDIIDTHNERSGQLDIVVEFPWLPSIPLFDDGPRLYLAEGVAACIEVKSDLSKQWPDVQQTAEKLSKISRELKVLQQRGWSGVPKAIPLFAIGYQGWKNKNTITKKLKEEEHLAGVLVLETAFMAFRREFGGFAEGPTIKPMEGAFCLWGLISCLDTIVKKIVLLDANPFGYCKREWL